MAGVKTINWDPFARKVLTILKERVLTLDWSTHTLIFTFVASFAPTMTTNHYRLGKNVIVGILILASSNCFLRSLTAGMKEDIAKYKQELKLGQ